MPVETLDPVQPDQLRGTHRCIIPSALRLPEMRFENTGFTRSDIPGMFREHPPIASYAETDGSKIKVW